jgi:hypothetical protein
MNFAVYSVTIPEGVKWSIFTPKSKLLCTRYNEGFGLFLQNSHFNKDFQEKIPNCTPKPTGILQPLELLYEFSLPSTNLVTAKVKTY